MLTATVSGSFHRHMDAISRAVGDLTDRGVRVVSPADPRVVEARGEFLFVASDRVRSVRLVQDRHLESIRCSDFLWLVAPDGYVGQSASMELGFAVGVSIPVFSLSLPCDLTLRQYVRQVPTLNAAIDTARFRAMRSDKPSGFLIDPRANLAAAHRTLEEIQHELDRAPKDIDEAVAAAVADHRRRLRALV